MAITVKYQRVAKQIIPIQYYHRSIWCPKAKARPTVVDNKFCHYCGAQLIFYKRPNPMKYVSNNLGIEEPLNIEEQAIDAAMDAHREAKEDEKKAVIAIPILYLPGLFLLIFGGDRVVRAGTLLILFGLMAVLLHIYLQYRSAKKYFEVKRLLNPYLRNKSMPFYNELLGMFADKPGVHLYLEEDGKILVTDKRNKEDKNA